MGAQRVPNQTERTWHILNQNVQRTLFALCMVENTNEMVCVERGKEPDGTGWVAGLNRCEDGEGREWGKAHLKRHGLVELLAAG